jgi:serine/threonine protein kinase
MLVTPPERWQQIEALFARALDCPADARPALLTGACAGDPALRAELERLLSAHERAGGFLEQLDTGRAAALVDAVGEEGAPGAAIGRYRVVRRLARGGMGVVFQAYDERLDRPVALKLLPPHLSADDAAGRRFVEEARAASALDHPHIITIYEVGETADERLFLAMAYYEGETLRERIARGPLPVSEAVCLALQVADGLAAAHRKRIVHRDIKPENLLVTADGAVKILDFGLAKMAGQALTRTGATLGTVAYMSPEQTRGAPVDHRTDLWSLGVVLYEMLAGVRPFGGEAEQALVYGIRHDEPPPLREVRPEVPPELARVVHRCLVKDPDERYPNAEALLAELREGASSSPAGRDEARSHTRYRSSRFRRWHASRRAIAATSLLLLLGVAAGGLALRADRGSGARDSSAARTLPAGTIVAVLPFAPSTPDSALVRLGRDLAVTLGANFDGVGEFRTLDVLPALLHRVPSGSTDRDAAQLVRGLGAQVVVQGDLVQTGGRVRADAALYLSAGTPPVARASATAAPEELAALTDSLTWSLLRQVWRKGPPPAPSLEAITTRSVPALRAFLEGERHLLDGNYGAALPAFSRAIEGDSTFWYAYWRYAKASAALERRIEPAIVQTYIAHRAEFPERDRLLIEAAMTDSLSVYLSRLRALTERFREYWPAWWEYADRLVHDGALVGYTHAEAREALERTVILNPQLAPAWRHLFWMSAADGDTVVAARSLRGLSRLNSGSEPGGDGLLYYRYVHYLMRSDGGIHPALADSLTLYALVHAARPEWLDQGVLRYGFPEATIDVMQRLLRHHPAEPLAAAAQRSIAGAWAARGAWDSALVAVEQYAGGTADPAATLYAYRLAAVGHWTGAVDAAEARRWRAILAPATDRLAPERRAELAWLDGLVAAMRQDRQALAAARSQLRRVESPAAPILDRSLAAFELDLVGERARAARMLVELERSRADNRRAYAQLADHHPFLTAVNRLTAGRWLLAQGDTALAAGLLAFHEGVPFPLPLTGHANYILAGPAYLERARIEEAAGRIDVARTYYWQFLRRYDLPLPAHRPGVIEARAALARLERRMR